MSEDRPRHGRDAPRPLARRAIVALVLGALLFVLVLVGASLWASHARTRARAAQLSTLLDGQMASYRRQRWTRPPLGAPAVDGNAWVAMRSAAHGLPRAPVEHVRSVLERGTQAPDALRVWAADHRPAIEEMLASTRRRWSWVAAAEPNPLEPPPMVPVLQVARTRLALAQNAPAGECLGAAAQAVRMGQDVAAGGAIIGLLLGAVIVEDVIAVATRCAERATPEERRAARADLAMLASHAPPAGAAMEVESFYVCGAARETVRGVPLVPLSGDEVAAWRISGDALDAWASVCRQPARWRTIAYPRLLAAIEHEQATRAGSHNDFLAIAAPDYLRHFVRDASAQTRLRALVVALDERIVLDGGARPAPNDAPRDPFTGGAFRVDRDEGAIRVRSAGPNRRDDRGAGDDVVVRIATTSRTP